MHHSCKSCWLPAISIPTGLSSNNLPLGVQIMSKPLTDNSLLNFAEMLKMNSILIELQIFKGLNNEFKTNYWNETHIELNTNQKCFADAK